MRILHVDTGRGWRGGQAQALLLAKGLAARGHATFLLCPGGSPLAAACRGAGLDAGPSSGRGDLSPRLALDTARTVARFRPQILHVHTAHALAPLLVARRFAVPGPVVSRRVSFPLRSGAVSRWKYGLARRIIAVSGAVARGLAAAGVDPGRIRTIHSGYDPSRFEDLPSRDGARRSLGWLDDDLIFLFAGALAPQKSIPVLFAAFRDLAAEPGGRRFRLVLAGDGPLRARLEADAAAAGLAGAVTFLGHRDDVVRLMAACDAVVLPSSEGEGSPAAVKEAMACGRAVVAVAGGGVEEIVEDGRTGLLVAPNDPVRLAGALRLLAADRSLRDSLGAAGRVSVARYTADRMVEATEDVYRELV